jgi:hypothetical protein
LFLHPEANQYARRVGRELDAGSGLFEALSLLKDDDTKAVAREGQGCGQPADASASNKDSARRRQVSPRGSLR